LREVVIGKLRTFKEVLRGKLGGVAAIALIHVFLLEELVKAFGQGNDTSITSAALARLSAHCVWPQFLGPLLLHFLYGMVDGFLGFLTCALRTTTICISH